MSEAGRLAPTRGSLVRALARLERVERGSAVLRRKREALVGELFRLARPAAGERARIAAEAEAAWEALLDALAVHGEAGLAALASPCRPVEVELRPGVVWGIVTTELTAPPRLARSPGGRQTAPASSGPAASEACNRFERLLERLLRAAPREMLLRRLGEALARTSRQVHTLERRIAPALACEIARVRSHLDEREREERDRLRRMARAAEAGRRRKAGGTPR